MTAGVAPAPGRGPAPGFAGLYRRDGAPITPADHAFLGAAPTRAASSGTAGSPPARVGFGPSPAAHRTGDLALVGEIRLDNGPELAAQLGIAPGPPPAGAALVLAAYARWGTDAVRRLYGDFAFGLWDGRRQQLVCARDALGLCPLYYFASPTTFAFASDAAAVLGLPEVPHRLQPDAITGFLLASFDDTAPTGYRHLHRLPPGHLAVVGPGRLTVRSYWQPDPATELRLRDDREYEEAFRDTLTAAIASRAGGAGPLGVSLSGGLDSTSITCVAAQAVGRPLLAYNATFAAGTPGDEGRWVDRVIATSGARRRPCDPEGSSPLEAWPGAPWHGPAPECTPQGSVGRVTLEAARADGVDVMLHGFGGDSVVSYGLGYLAELVGSGRLLRAARETEAVARRHGMGRRGVWMGSTLGPYVPAVVGRAWGAFRPGGAAPRPDVVRPALVAAWREARPPVPMGRTARARHVAAVTAGIMPAVLEASHRVDALSGVQRRYPFLDRRLVELCVSLPGDQKLRDGWTRSIMRRALAGTIPTEVEGRTGKGNLGPAFVRALGARDQALVGSVVESPGRLAEWVDAAALTALRRRCADGGTDRDWFDLWRAVVAAQWLTHHGFDEPRPAAGGAPRGPGSTAIER